MGEEANTKTEAIPTFRKKLGRPLWPDSYLHVGVVQLGFLDAEVGEGLPLTAVIDAYREKGTQIYSRKDIFISTFGFTFRGPLIRPTNYK